MLPISEMIWEEYREYESDSLLKASMRPSTSENFLFVDLLIEAMLSISELIWASRSGLKAGLVFESSEPGVGLVLRDILASDGFG